MPESLFEALQRVPDHRSPRGRSYPLAPVLALVVLGMLLGRRSWNAIARVIPDYQGDLAISLGFPRLHGPCASALGKIFRRLDTQAFEKVLSEWVQTQFPDPPPSVQSDTPPMPIPVQIDGKTLRGSRIPDAEVPGVHLISAFAPSIQAVLTQMRVDSKTNEHKAALELLKRLPPRPEGYLISGDAMFCQKEICEQIIKQGDDYLLTVKDNQPGLATQIEAGLTFAAMARTFSP